MLLLWVLREPPMMMMMMMMEAKSKFTTDRHRPTHQANAPSKPHAPWPTGLVATLLEPPCPVSMQRQTIPPPTLVARYFRPNLTCSLLALGLALGLLAAVVTSRPALAADLEHLAALQPGPLAAHLCWALHGGCSQQR